MIEYPEILKKLTNNARPCKDCAAKNSNNETELVEWLQSLVDYGNSTIMRSQKVRLELEDC